MKIDECGVLVTGGSQGLGAALGRELARRGARVALVARNRAPLDDVVAGINGAGGQAFAIVGDISDKASIHGIAAAAAAAVNGISVLIHNASTLGPVPMVPLLETNCEDVSRTLETNLVGPFRLSKLVLGQMLLDGRGLIIHISSDAAVSAYAGWGAYGISKAAADHMVRIWAEELSESGVRFLSVDPGEMNTRMHADAAPDADPEALAHPDVVAIAIANLIEYPDAQRSGGRSIVDPVSTAERRLL